nr:BatD family protein [Deltaproteobacteria bacterium]
MRHSLFALFVLITLGAFAGTASADEPRAQFRLDGGQPHVDVPFQLELMVDGFDEQPAPVQPKLELPNATVTPLGATPNVSRSIQIVNGRRSESARVTWALRWRVEVHKAGGLRVPATTVVQGAKSATAPAGDVSVGTVPVADDMKISLELPNRPVFVGETVPVTMTWLFRRQPQDQTFNVPMLSSDAFLASAPPVTGQRRALPVSAGAKELQLPFAVDQVGGSNRLIATFYIAPKKAGKIDIAPASVVAALAVGRADFFGNAPSQMFRASDVARTLEVKALPETDRPPTFAGAVGDQFSMEVRTSRSVVSLGEPVELVVKVKSNQLLDTLSLGKLDGEGRLPKDKFTVPAEPPTGELSDEGKTKTFKITAQVTAPTTEIPALAFSYFDPTRSTYQTIHSEPIALSVKGGSFVGAGDVVSATPSKRTPTATVTDDTSALVNADLALSGLGAVDD